MAFTVYQVDAFADRIFSGNPAAVMHLWAFFDDQTMQNLAAENNVSETAFVVPTGEAGHYDLRWFTPTLEIDFCGHATVATAHVLAKELDVEPPFHFSTKVGALTVDVKDGLYVLDAPVFPARPCDITDEIRAAFPVPLKAAFLASDNLFLEFKSASDVRNIRPDMSLVKPLSTHGVGITAKSLGDYDCVSRFFVPAQGIDEDPVTGSAHAAIGPYWAAKLDKNKLTAYQASKRGGVLHLDVGKKRLTISGNAVTYLKGEVYI